MDPQQRCLLETVYEGVESAGYSIPKLQGSSTGVFVGVMSFDYQFAAMRGLDSLPQYHATGTHMSILANRLSYFFDWRGPSVACDTACSSSLVALHQAVLALRNGDVTMAVAAGANLILGPEPFIALSNVCYVMTSQTLFELTSKFQVKHAVPKRTILYVGFICRWLYTGRGLCFRYSQDS